jgi:hypothetical protein
VAQSRANTLKLIAAAASAGDEAALSGDTARRVYRLVG